jgi:hypothetical protein
MYTIFWMEVIFNMKTMTCKQLGGICDEAFQAESFEQIAELAKKHGMEMFLKADEPHMKAMVEMKELMENPEKMQDWMEKKEAEYNALPEDK